MCVYMYIYVYNYTYMCVHAHVRELNFLRRIHTYNIEATLARHGGHDSMTSTGRVLFSKGDSTVAASRGEIARRHKQPEHAAIGRGNNKASSGRCERAEYVERTRSVAFLSIYLSLSISRAWMESIFTRRHANLHGERVTERIPLFFFLTK